MIGRPYLILGCVLVWGASLVGVGIWQHGAGVDAERVTWQARENVQITQANAQIRRLTDAAIANERAAAARQAAIEKDYQNELKNANDSHQAALAALRAGALRLRDPGAATVQACRDTEGAAPAGAGERDGEAGAGLSSAASQFLLDEAARANTVVLQLQACQEVVRADRKLCGQLQE